MVIFNAKIVKISDNASLSMHMGISYQWYKIALFMWKAKPVNTGYSCWGKYTPESMTKCL